MADFIFPPMGYGPGSQPAPDGELEYMTMPQDMRTFSLHIPEVEADPALEPALALLDRIARACAEAANGAPNARFDLAGLDRGNRALMAETLGQGEVSMRIHGIPAIAAQESVFAGVWVLKGAGLDVVEVGKVPTASLTRAFEPRRRGLGVEAPRQPGVLNAPPLMVELGDKSAAYVEGQEPHVVNLTLLPHTEQDLAWMDQALGQGSTEILSRGYGNCRISATALAHVWRVQFFNSMDTLILDTFEVTGMPEVALAADEDLSDSAERILEVLEAIR
ncbi:hydrogenase expression/formation protein [Tropicibacter sp. S64]|uniref:hydrogenase expression/formation protein n=1 Tax=Tropicibacter sp. S64 TaxID=3415122 RepID=UPI003C7DCC76